MKILKYLPVILLLAACGGSVKTPAIDTTKVVATDTNLFDKPVTILIEPSARLVEKTQAKMESSNYKTIFDDNVFYLSESEHYLDSIKAYKVNRQSEGELKFKTPSGTIYSMRLDTLFFGTMLFNGKDKPIMADMTIFKTEFEDYMKK